MQPVTPAPSERGPRNDVIDLLRGVAIVAVLLLHFQIAYRMNWDVLRPWLPKAVVSSLAWNGNYGVTIFFVVSGYLITTNALERYGALSAIAWRDFYRRRFARIAPPLLLMLAVVVALSRTPLEIFHQNEEKTSLGLAVFSVLAFWHNVLMAHAGYFNYCLNVLWSLSVEEVFYLAFPLLWLLLRRERRVFAVWGALVAIGPLYRSAHPTDEIVAMYAYLSCFDAIALGCLAAFVAARLAWRPTVAKGVGAAGAVLLAATYLSGSIMEHVVFGFTGVALGTAMIVATSTATTMQGRRRLFGRGLMWLGRHSYELYLFHVVILGLMRSVAPKATFTGPAKLAWLAVYLAVSATVAWATARFFAEPIPTLDPARTA
jgi:peptidoglycan/LPS O-acetylase OafA/YrhL